MLARTARYIAHELSYDADREEVLHFGLQLVTNMVLNVLAIAIVGYLLGTLWITLFAALVAGTLKIFAGGAHASTSRNCIIIGTLYFGLTGWVAARWGPDLSPFAAAPIFAAVAGSALWAIWRYAPLEPPEKPLQSRAHRDNLRVASFLALTLWLAVTLILGVVGWRAPTGSETLRSLFAAGIAGLVWQSMIVTPRGCRLVALADEMITPSRERR